MSRNAIPFRRGVQPRSVSVARQIETVALLELGVVCALWGRGAPALILALLPVFPATALLSRLPTRFLPDVIRRGLQILLAGIAVWWCYGRFGRVPSDLALGEALGILLIPLLLRANVHEHALAVLMAAVLAGYGGVAAPGTLYLPAVLGFVLIGLLLLYGSRGTGLTGNAGPGTAPDLRGIPGGSWRGRSLFPIIHLGFFVVGWAALMAVLPQPIHPSAGLMPVSYPSWQHLELFRFWKPRARTPHEIGGDRGPSNLDREGDPGEPGRNRGRTTQNWVGKNRISSVQGAGRAAAGRDLVFRVQSPAKFYWLARLYDDYDGNTWRTSPALDHYAHLPPPLRLPGNTVNIQQNVTVEKDVTPRLCSAFRVNLLRWQKAPERNAEPIWRPPFRLTWAGATMRPDPPPLPWHYTCISSVVVQPRKQERGVWYDPLPRRHYVKLPEDGTLARVRHLAKEVTTGCASDMEKATALRDFMRKDFSYTLKPPPPPPGLRALDYFLFESRKGYCIHFAEALTVLARGIGLPARVATGYAPGNYNLVTGCFEVYEYHAHAWAQIFVEPYGWLTFDGVPPGALSLRTVPLLLGAFHDPFGDEWSTRTPELAAASTVRKETPTDEDSNAVKTGDSIARSVGNFLEQISEIKEAASKPGGIPAAVRAVGAATGHAAQAVWERFSAGLAGWWNGFGGRLDRLGRGVVGFFAGLSTEQVFALLAAVVVATVVLVQRSRLRRLLAGAYRRYRARRMWREMLRVYPLRTPQTVFLAAAMSAELLRLRGYCRPMGMDITEYAEWLHWRRRGLGHEFERIAAAVRETLFSPRELDAAQIEEVFRAAVRIHAALASRSE